MGNDAARQLQALRRREPKVCPVCGIEFVGLKRQMYDTKLCANKAAYQRNGRADRQRKAGPQEAGSEDGERPGVS